jgi:(4-O-methyl)-D-glucuronate---lignin esterase
MRSVQHCRRCDHRWIRTICFAWFVLLSAPALAPQSEEYPSPGIEETAWPDPLVLLSGNAVRTRDTFERQRRPEILRLFEENVYGRTPSTMLPVRIVRSEVYAHALHGLARRIQTTLVVGPNGERTWHLLQYMPASARGKIPVFIGLNFDGNQTVDGDPGINLNPIWAPDRALKKLHLAKELSRHGLLAPAAASRGAAASQWQVETIVARGYGLATIYCGDIEPDYLGGMSYGIRPLLLAKTQSLPAADDWGAIGAWAWGMGRIVDVLSKDPTVDPNGFIAFGFSRFGKTSLWAGAQDKRFAVVISNESGQAGATLSHRRQGEPIDHLMLAFPYWFCANYQRFLGHVDDLPVDGHLLLSLIAPRALYIGSAIDDPFSDPEGEFLAARDVSPVYGLYGKTGITDKDMPGLEHPIGDTVAYHVRHGGHDVTAYDWDQYLNFADRQLQHKSQ